MKKKANGEGTITKRGNSWRGQLTVSGERISVTGRTKSEVLDRMAQIRADQIRGQYVGRDNTTVAEWIDIWLRDKKKPKLAEQSYIRLKALFHNHLIPVMGDYKLQDLTTSLLEQKYAEIFHEKKGKDYAEKGYSHSTVNSLSVSFKQCLQYAVDRGLLNKNPHEGVELHKLRPPKKVSAYTLDEHKKIVDYTRNNGDLYWIFYILISTGMRFGEAVALTWEDVDLRERTININKISTELHGSPVIQNHTKTEAGTRTIVVPGNVADFLKEIQKEQDPDLNYRDLVLPNRRYNIITSANTRRRWQRVCAELDIPYKGVHALRHTWATRALEAGIDVKTVSDMLGHKNVITTMNIYQDALQDHKEAAADKLNNLF